MQAGATAAYESVLQSGRTLALCTDDGRVIPMDVPRWLGVVDAADESVVRRCVAPVLDVGCGPGRFVAALAAAGVPVLGVDVAEAAVRLNRRHGRSALWRDVFRRLPGEGRWPTVLLMDGNIGIGGNPHALLTRLAGLTATSGHVLVETHPTPCMDEVLTARLAVDGHVSGAPFDWALVGSAALARYAAGTGHSVAESWSAGGRTFVRLIRS